MVQKKLQELLALKDRTGLTNRQIAELSKVPESTVGRILRGATGDPRYETVCEMIQAMETYIAQNQADGEVSDGGVTETCQAQASSEIPAETNHKNLAKMYESRLSDQGNRIEDLKAQISDLRQVNEKLRSNIAMLSRQNSGNRRRFIIALLVAACAVTFICALFCADFMHPARGWVMR